MKKPTIEIYQSPDDGAWVVRVDTEEHSPEDCNADGPFPLRVYINDGITYANPVHSPSQAEELQEIARKYA
ncbi:hypothetical protein LCGC14_0609960 [marine sediment metagenome]|uniref:Uncharacterized protein n=1 Tax=marine sediment metagenome TaxID=412755 RepID=A0A0F9R846_9ZZZZ